MKSSVPRLLFLSLALSFAAACAGATSNPVVEGPPAPTATATGAVSVANSIPQRPSSAVAAPAHVATEVPRGTLFQISAEDAVAAGPLPPGARTSDGVAYYRVARDPSGSFFWLGSFSENDHLLAAGLDVTDADVAAVLAVVRKNAAALRCDPAAGRTPYMTRRIDVEGELSIHVQSDCRGTYPDEASAPAEYRAFKQALREVEHAMLGFVKRFMRPRGGREQECKSHADCPGQVCVMRSTCACGGAALQGSICMASFPKCTPCTGQPRP